MNIQEIMSAYKVSQATAYRYQENGIPSCKLRKYSQKYSLSELSKNLEKEKVIKTINEKNEKNEKSENEKSEKNEKNEKNNFEKMRNENEKFEKLINAILRIEDRLNRIENLQISIIERIDNFEKMRNKNEKNENENSEKMRNENEKNEKKGEGGFSLEDSNTTIESIVIEDSKKENKKRKNEKNENEKIKNTFDKNENDKNEKKTKRRLPIKDIIDTPELEILKEFVIERFPKGRYKPRLDDTVKAWMDLAKNQKQDLLNNMDSIVEFYKDTDFQWIPNLTGFIKTRKWETLNYNLQKTQKGFYSKSQINVEEEIMRRMQRQYGA